MPTEFAPNAHTDPEFVCGYKEWMRLACAGEGFFREYEGQRYCALHYPGKDKIAAFNAALQKKLKVQDFDFRGVWFPQAASFENVQFGTAADFTSATFSARAYFVSAIFSGTADFSGATFLAEANFSKATFSMETNFTGATFNSLANFFKASFSAYTDFIGTTFRVEARFAKATFNSLANFFKASFCMEAYFTGSLLGAYTNFNETTFSTNVYFGGADFNGDVTFSLTTFDAEADFNSATFAAFVRFAGDKNHPVFGEGSYLDLQYAQIEKPERVSFHSFTLRPHWFINVDARKFEFVNVKWPSTGLTPEIESLRDRKVESPHRLLSIAYRRLAVNAEENHRYREAAKFRYGSMDVRRQEDWRGMAFWRLTWWYWLLSGYGERITWAAGCLLLILVLFAGLYTQVGFVSPADQTTKPTAVSPLDQTTKPTAPITTPDTVGTPLHFTQALVHSFEVSILQKPEPKPLTLTARFFVGLETVLGPLQAALLALAIRRKFMR